MKKIFFVILIFTFLLCGCGDSEPQDQKMGGGAVGDNPQKAPQRRIIKVQPANLKSTDIANKWSVEEGREQFPLVDFSKLKTVNEGAISQEEKAKEKAAQAYLRQVHKKIRQNQDPIVLRNKLATKYHNTQAAIDAAFAYAQYQTKKSKEQGVKAYEWILTQWPESYRKWNAVYQIHNLLDISLYVYNYGSYHALNAKDFRFHVNGRNLKKVEVAVYQVDLLSMLEEGVNPQSPAVPAGAKLVKKWTEDFSNERRQNWFNRQIKLPSLKPSYHILSISTPYITYNTLFSTSHVALVCKSDGKMLLSWAKDQTNKKSVGTSQVVVLKGGKIVYNGSTNKDGLFVARMKMRSNDSSNFAVIVDTPQGQAASGSYYYWYNSYYRRVGYAYTDRPVYRPGQTVHYKGIFRSIDDQENMVVKNQNPIQVTLYDTNWKQIFQKNIKMGEFGTITDEYQIPKTARLGNYYLYFYGGDGYSSQVYFSVEEYKKPEYEVMVESEKSNVIQGDSCSVTASARYYFGEPVKEAQVEYQVYESIQYWYSYYPWGYKRHWGWFAEESHSRYNYSSNERLVSQGKTKLDAEGKAKIEFKTKTNNNNDLKYRIRVAVIDKSRRKISGYGSVLATRAEFRLSVSTNRSFYRPGEKIQIKARATDYGDKGLSVPVSLAISKQVKSGYVKLYTELLKTNDKGWASHDFIPDENAYYQFMLTAEDQSGRKITTNHYCWVADSNWRSPISYSGINIELEKSTCEPGEKARVLVTSGYSDSWALLTTENQNIQSYNLVKLNGGVYADEISIHQKMQPYVSFKASLLERGGIIQTEKRITVPPVQKFLDVNIARDQKEYKPGDKATYTVKISDWKKQPVKAEFSFGVVDEAIYAIRADSTPDIRKVFHNKQTGYVYTYTSFQFYAQGYGKKSPAKPSSSKQLLAKNEKSKEMADAAPAEAEEKVALGRAKRKAGGKAQGLAQKKLVQPRMRSEFADSGVWQAKVVTDDQGIAKINFTMPDNLTTWRTTIRAITIDGKAGQQLDKVITRKNLMARLECPRTFTERDRVTVSGVIHNYLSSKKQAVCRLKVKGARLLTNSEQNIELKPGEDKRVDWIIEVNSIEKVELELAALTDEESDAMRQSFPIVPHGSKMRESNSGMTEDEAIIKLTLPESTVPNRSKLIVRVKPTLAGSMLESLDYLAGYPYGCVEQTMSRFLPSVIVAQTLQTLRLRNKKLEENLPKYVAKGTERLYNFQHSDGGWGWWEHDQTNPFMTAYVIYGLSIARESDFAIDHNVISRGMNALRNMINQEKKIETKAYMVFAYSQIQKPEAKWLDQLYAGVDEMNDYSRTILLLTMHKCQDKRAKELLTMLEKNADLNGDFCSFSGKAWRYSWTDNPVETTAYCLKAIVNMNPKHPLIPKILKWLEIRKQGDHYRSTKDTAAVVFAFADYLSHSRELNPNYTGTAIVNGEKHAFSFQGEKANGEMTEFSFTPKKGQNEIKLSKNGKGKLYYTAYIDYYSNEENLKAHANGISVRREYFRLIPKQKDGTIQFERKALDGEVAQGEVFEVVLTMSGIRDYQYLMLEDFIPAGCEFEKDTDPKHRKPYYYYNWSNKEERDDRLVVFFGYYSQGKRQISYKLRAETPGDFHAMPAHASMMYFPEITGNSAEHRLSILPDKK